MTMIFSKCEMIEPCAQTNHDQHFYLFETDIICITVMYEMDMTLFI